MTVIVGPTPGPVNGVGRLLWRFSLLNFPWPADKMGEAITPRDPQPKTDDRTLLPEVIR
jgi:hypothetical protein